MTRARALIAVLACATVVTANGVAAPPGKGLETVEADCGGTTIAASVSGGSSFWIGSTHYVVMRFSGVFTPVEGDPESFTQTFGNKTGKAAGAITCTGGETDESGTFSFEVTGVAVP